MYKMKSLKNKVVVITGGGGVGMGNALVKEFAKAGAHVATCDIANLEKTEKEISQYEVEKYFEKVDVGNMSALEGFANNVIRKFGRVDILINNAGIALGEKNFGEVTFEDFQKITNINYWGVVRLTQLLYPYLLKSPEGAIASTSSVYGFVGMPYVVPYCTTKFAVRGFSEGLRTEHKIRGIKNVTVHSIHPGAVKTAIQANTEYKSVNADAFQKLLETGVSSEDAAKTIIEGIMKNKPRILVSEAYQYDWVSRILPDSYEEIISMGMHLKGMLRP
jgi:NAD(P)-dependent dehydrogenase (short-subunit alcohol dehydrogenase family)